MWRCSFLYQSVKGFHNESVVFFKYNTNTIFWFSTFIKRSYNFHLHCNNVIYVFIGIFWNHSYIWEIILSLCLTFLMYSQITFSHLLEIFCTYIQEGGDIHSLLTSPLKVDRWECRHTMIPENGESSYRPTYLLLGRCERTVSLPPLPNFKGNVRAETR